MVSSIKGLAIFKAAHPTGPLVWQAHDERNEISFSSHSFTSSPSHLILFTEQQTIRHSTTVSYCQPGYTARLKIDVARLDLGADRLDVKSGAAERGRLPGS